MTQIRRIRSICLLLLLVTACSSTDSATNAVIATRTSPAVVAAATCPTIVEAALATTNSACEDTARNQACYGNVRLDVEAREGVSPFSFEQQGDKVDLARVRTLTLSSMNEVANEWGVALMRVQANLPDALPGQNVTFLLFGEVAIENQSLEVSASPMQAFRFSTGVSDSICADAPESGILIQTPEGVGEIQLTANGVEITLSSTAYLQAEAGADLTVNMLEGQAEVEAAGVIETVSAGEQVQVPMDNNLQAAGPPSPAQPYNLATLDALPVANLERAIVIAPNTVTTSTNITEEGSIEASSTYTGFPASLAVDDDRSTSWFSAGPGPAGEPSVYRWTGTQDEMITAIRVLSNAEHREPSFRTGFGFGSMIVQVLDVDDNVVFEQAVSLDGTPDPDIVLEPDVIGRSVVLTLDGHEDPTCGGFSELQIEADR